MTTFHGLTLDRFQEEAIRHLDAGKSVVVSAATGTGKTLIADYAIDQSFRQGRKAFYTAPIKALSNQKFREFKASYGENKVGILTGDVVINPGAPLLIMTTEIYRNMLLVRDPCIDDLAVVIFDEIHYLGDRERGTVWEEAIIFGPEHVRMLCLSATIPNAKEFARWISTIKHHPVEVVTETKRAVPLQHEYYSSKSGFTTLEDISREARKKDKYKPRTHRDLIRALEGKERLPCIYFCFSRAKTEQRAEELAQGKSFIGKEEQQRAGKLIAEHLASWPHIRDLATTRLLSRCLRQGIAFHHAGLLPVLKEIVELAFADNLIAVLYATETFAVGINLPARAVCFDSLEKYDGIEFRYLSSKEYFQLAGRAGRRGMDKVGYAISYVDPRYADVQQVRRITSSDSEPLESQYTLSPNTVLNMIALHSWEERKVILTQSYSSFQSGQGTQVMDSYEKMIAMLEKGGYLDHGELTLKGQFARRVYQEELLLTDLFCTEREYSDVEVLVIVGCLELEPRPGVRFRGGGPVSARLLKELPLPLAKILKKRRPDRVEPLLSAWYEGEEFTRLLRLTTMPEGDIIRFFRRVIDVLQQLHRATTDSRFAEQVSRCISGLDRDIVEVRL